MAYVFPTYIHCIGIKGSGLAALAVLLKQSKHTISGSDTNTVFYTDLMLKAANIVWNTGFHPHNIPQKTQLVIHSTAYTPENNAELAYARDKALPCLSYPVALGMFSRTRESWSVVGTHGKTTTTAFIGVLCKSQALCASVLSGGALPDFGNNAVLHQGENVFFAEVCEYKNHFAHFSPDAAVFTSAEWDHPDYFHSNEDVYEHFLAFVKRLPKHAPLIACIDNVGVQKTLSRVEPTMTHMYLYTSAPEIPRAFQNTGAQIIRIKPRGIVLHEGTTTQSFSLKGLNPDADALVWHLPMPSAVLTHNATAALISVATYMKNHDIAINWHTMHHALAHCKGVSRRSEVLHHDERYIIMDDYAHHPTAIEKTLEGIAAFYRPKRLRVNFMPHTHSRTKKLWNDFLSCFSSADEVIVNDVYASAREDGAGHENTVHNAQHLAKGIAAQYEKKSVCYIPTIEKTITYIENSLQHGDLFLSMGAGDNFRTSHAIAKKIQTGRIV